MSSVPSDPNTPPPLPCRSQPLAYHSTPPPAGWAVLAVFPSVTQWHAAKGLLAHHGIEARMSSIADDGSVQLLVISTELEWARDILASRPPPKPPPSGFPVVQQNAPATPQQPAPSFQSPAPPPLPARFMPQAVIETDHLRIANQSSRYKYAVPLALLWIIFIALTAFILWALLV